MGHKMDRERDAEAWLRREIEKIGGEFWKFTSPGRDGVPDRIALLPVGRVVFVEMKKSGEHLPPIQRYHIERLRSMGCEACVVYGRDGAKRFLRDFSLAQVVESEYGREVMKP